MTEALLRLGRVGCPVGMGVMMWLMMRGDNHAAPTPQPSRSSAGDAELAALRTEVDQLRAEQRDTPGEVGVRSSDAWLT